jgi:hypothetical protein
MHQGCVLPNFAAIGKQQGEFIKKNQLTLLIVIDTHPSLSKFIRKLNAGNARLKPMGCAACKLIKHKYPGPLGQVRVNWLCRRQISWGDGILEIVSINAYLQPCFGKIGDVINGEA